MSVTTKKKPEAAPVEAPAPAKKPSHDDKLRDTCRRALELLKSQAAGNEHIQVQANALLAELEK